jgi:hypothetical protein
VIPAERVFKVEVIDDDIGVAAYLQPAACIQSSMFLLLGLEMNV